MLTQLHDFGVLDFLDIIIVAFVFYRVIIWIRGARCAANKRPGRASAGLFVQPPL